MVNPEEMKVVEKKYDDEKIRCKKIKKACIDIVDSFCECMEKDRKEIMVKIKFFNVFLFQ